VRRSAGHCWLDFGWSAASCAAPSAGIPGLYHSGWWSALNTAVDAVGLGVELCAAWLLAVQPEDLTAVLIVSTAEALGLMFSLLLVHCLGRKPAVAVPLGLIAVVLVPMMAGEMRPLVTPHRGPEPRLIIAPHQQTARSEHLYGCTGSSADSTQ
jgi:hypothetical protein